MNIAHLINNGKAAATILALVGLMFVSRTAGATTLIYKNFDDLVSEAEAIVVGTVRQAESHKGPGAAICTFVTLTDLQIIHGNYKANALVMRLEGGNVEGIEQVPIGSPAFSRNDRVLIFLRGNGKLMVPTVGWTQGVFRITHDPVSAQDVITDYAGNGILGIENNELIKEPNRSSETGTADATFIPGVAEDGSIPEIVGSQYQDTSAGRTLSADEFINAINERIAATGKPSTAIDSVTVGDFNNLQLIYSDTPDQ